MTAKIKDTKVVPKRAKGKEFAYLRVDIISSGSSLFRDGYSEQYFKMTTEEYEGLSIRLGLNDITEQHKIDHLHSMKAPRRGDKLYRDILHIKQKCKILGIYKFDIPFNVLKDDIPMEIREFCYINKDKPLTSYRVDEVL